MNAPGYKWLRVGAYTLFAGGIICSVFGWISVLSGINSALVLIYCMQALLALFAAVDAFRSKGAPRRARNCIVDAICVVALSVIVMVQTNGFMWYLIPLLAGAVMIGIGGYLNYRVK